MTKVQFKVFEAVCKRAWTRLSKNLDTTKPAYLYKYLNRCPACEIANLAYFAVFLRNFSELPRGRYNQLCTFCPITIWREQVLTTNHGAVCQLSENAYGRWLYCDDDGRKKAAALVASYDWEYLPEYKKIKV